MWQIGAIFNGRWAGILASYQKPLLWQRCSSTGKHTWQWFSDIKQIGLAPLGQFLVSTKFPLNVLRLSLSLPLRAFPVDAEARRRRKEVGFSFTLHYPPHAPRRFSSAGNSCSLIAIEHNVQKQILYWGGHFSRENSSWIPNSHFSGQNSMPFFPTHDF